MTTATALVTPQADLAQAGPLGSLDAYIDRVGRIPVLSREEEHDLAVRTAPRTIWTRRANSCSRHLRFVVHIARGYTGYGLPMGRPDPGRQRWPDEGREAL